MQYSYIHKDKVCLYPEWVQYKELDNINIELAKYAKRLTKGMTNDLLAAAFYWVKPLHCTGMDPKRWEIRDYWLRLCPNNLKKISE